MTLQEYARRRQVLLAKMVPGSAALIFAAPEVLRSADINYPYRQNSDFWYFTGFNEPQALLILIKRDKNNNYSILFNRVRNTIAELWRGRCLGQEAAQERLGVSRALPWDEIDSQLHLLLQGLEVIYHAPGEYAFADRLLWSALEKSCNCCGRQKLPEKAKLVDWRPWVHDMRLIKSEEELVVIRRACEISALGHTRAMQQCRCDMYEYQLEGEMQHEFNRHGARFTSYDTIVGSGENGCMLHYTENTSTIKNGDLVLIDAGCEYQCYASDITRTFPVNGRFSPAQRAIYDLVLAMLNRSVELYGPGRSIQEVTEEAVRIMVTGMVQLGVMKGNVEVLIRQQAYQQFFMHGLSHWLGLDVHDVGDYGSSERSRVLEVGMVLTIEPGIYIASAAHVPSAYRGIGIRIEDTIVITPTGNENVTASAVKDAEAIESLMAASYIE